MKYTLLESNEKDGLLSLKIRIDEPEWKEWIFIFRNIMLIPLAYEGDEYSLNIECDIFCTRAIKNHTKDEYEAIADDIIKKVIKDIVFFNKDKKEIL